MEDNSPQEKHGDTHTQQCCLGNEGEEGNVSNPNDKTTVDTNINEAGE